MIVNKPGQHYDVVVIGAGMVGASFALTLQQKAAHQPVTVLVIESQAVDAGKIESPSFDARSTALSLGSTRLLEKAGLWNVLQNQVTPIRHIHVSDQGRFGSTHLDTSEQRADALGYVVENRHLGKVFGDRLLNAENIDCMGNTRVEAIKSLANAMQLTLSLAEHEKIEIKTSLVVLAEGGRSPLKDSLGIDVTWRDYGQHAIVSNIGFEKPHNNIAYERFTSHGPLAVLPLPDLQGSHRGAMVWCVDKANAESVSGMPDHEALALLQERFGYRLGHLTRLGERGCYPLQLGVAREQIRPGLVLLGNVAHTLHPVAGQGFNLALRDADSLARILTRARHDQKPLGDMQVLQQFLQCQEADQTRTIFFSDYLTRLFSSDQPHKVWARKAGLAALDLVPPLRRRFAKMAMGLADR